MYFYSRIQKNYAYNEVRNVWLDTFLYSIYLSCYCTCHSKYIYASLICSQDYQNGSFQSLFQVHPLLPLVHILPPMALAHNAVMKCIVSVSSYKTYTILWFEKLVRWNKIWLTIFWIFPHLPWKFIQERSPS